MANYSIQRTYADIDALCAAARAWDVEFRPIEGGGLGSRMLQARSGPVLLSEGRFRQGLVQRGVPPRGHWTFVVPASDGVAFRWRGHSVRGDSILVFPLNGELYSVSGADFHVYTIAVAEEHLQAACESLHLPGGPQLFAGAEVFRTKPAAVAQLRSVLRRTSRALSGGVSVEHPRVAMDLRGEIPALLLAAIASATGRADPIAPSRLQLVHAAEAYLAGVPAQTAASVRGLSALVGTSERTLRRAFVDVYGLGPKEFSLGQRFNEVRRLLRDADPASDRVSTLAGRHGFWHMGSFAAEYRRRFGELPSRTLQRA